ncbi:AP-5 complex subunit sigma-1-like [Asterias rubens]|uniref:AP-5 complex subunit sigma-1-like n=1 Tax=Asterias rubens TaxID=7604 RepID=UPI001455C6A9|nr:AP-5 complex subunit sigma-1-like [Asterias rubens]
MVYAFIIHTLNLSAGAGMCRVLYSSVFGSDGTPDYCLANMEDQTGSSPASVTLSQQQLNDMRTVRKEQLALVARQVQSEYSFRKAVHGGDHAEQDTSFSGLLDDPSQFEHGMFRLKGGDPFQGEKITVWLGLGSVGLALICEKNENRLLAEGALKLLARYLQEHVQVLTQPAELLTKGDRVAVIVHQFLPSGRLLFMNHAVTKQIERDMDNLLRGK